MKRLIFLASVTALLGGCALWDAAPSTFFRYDRIEVNGCDVACGRIVFTHVFNF